MNASVVRIDGAFGLNCKFMSETDCHNHTVIQYDLWSEIVFHDWIIITACTIYNLKTFSPNVIHFDIPLNIVCKSCVDWYIYKLIYNEHQRLKNNIVDLLHTNACKVLLYCAPRMMSSIAFRWIHSSVGRFRRPPKEWCWALQTCTVPVLHCAGVACLNVHLNILFSIDIRHKATQHHKTSRVLGWLASSCLLSIEVLLFVFTLGLFDYNCFFGRHFMPRGTKKGLCVIS